jgi:glutathione S-transferase
MGDRFTTADIILAPCLTWAIDYGVEICNSAVPYLERTKSRPAYPIRGGGKYIKEMSATATRDVLLVHSPGLREI